MSRNRLQLAALAATAAAGLADLAWGPARDVSLLFALLVAAALLQGAVALAAAAELTQARWLEPLRVPLLGAAPALFALPLLFPLLARHLSVYPWRDQPGAWLNGPFFLARNEALLLLAAGLGLAFARAAARRRPRAARWAVCYLAAFVACQSLLAFDWVMPLDWPWVSTLFGGYFFVEALYAGVAVTALLAAQRARRDPLHGRAALRDAATLLFGFALLWAGLFYSQFLVIWYGNIPGEVGYLTERLAQPGLQGLGAWVLAGFFLLPFPLLVSRRAKEQPRRVAAVAVLPLSALLAERLFFLLGRAALRPGLAAALLFLAGLPAALLWLTAIRPGPARVE